jgi:peroxiredoxin
VPYTAEPVALADCHGKSWSLAEHDAGSVVLIFFLGGKCAHCMQQLQAFSKSYEEIRAMGAELVAIGTDGPEATRALAANLDGIKFPMPLLPDPELRAFRAYRAYDDFEQQPLHATFLIDHRGAVRFHRIAADPFLDVDFVRAELARLKRICP